MMSRSLRAETRSRGKEDTKRSMQALDKRAIHSHLQSQIARAASRSHLIAAAGLHVDASKAKVADQADSCYPVALGEKMDYNS
ncbi:hypothetical protein E2C01_054837 [Portunus trituberculatus]|uniref:Uncharacterized protein n=1 Tax=Portunus trituberculatus TaxID=210409 RepID=A0A5B7GKW5_PORTR|nr:hypothetical protein [Portunus trituberculatus]